MNISISTDRRLFYVQLVELFALFKPLKDLNGGDKRILSEILYKLSLNRTLKPNIRRNIVFSKEGKKDIYNALGIKPHVLYNGLYRLRKKGVLDKDNYVSKFLEIYPEDSYKFSISFTIDEEKAENN